MQLSSSKPCVVILTEKEVEVSVNNHATFTLPKSRMSQTSGEQICFKVPVLDLVQSGSRLAYPPGS